MRPRSSKRFGRCRWGLAVATLEGDDDEIVLDSGDDELTRSTLFQIGSLTKTMTGVLLADCVLRGEATLDMTVSSILPSPGNASRGRCAIWQRIAAACRGFRQT